MPSLRAVPCDLKKSFQLTPRATFSSHTCLSLVWFQPRPRSEHVSTPVMVSVAHVRCAILQYESWWTDSEGVWDHESGRSHLILVWPHCYRTWKDRQKWKENGKICLNGKRIIISINLNETKTDLFRAPLLYLLSRWKGFATLTNLFITSQKLKKLKIKRWTSTKANVSITKGGILQFLVNDLETSAQTVLGHKSISPWKGFRHPQNLDPIIYEPWTVVAH